MCASCHVCCVCINICNCSISFKCCIKSSNSRRKTTLKSPCTPPYTLPSVTD
uniref:Uncharacterized protein n=1 Tax=Myoviridae sp. ctgXL3 TaxID=2826681 RepID=A0A8S5QQW9_9CAUD|nr:MAG TPA: hypothetical protein [Myoviridae sp. ctgXL3]